MDYTTGVLRWSETLEAHYGLRPGTFGGTVEAFVERIHPDDRGSVIETLGNAKKTGADFSLQHRAVWPDGTVRWLRARAVFTSASTANRCAASVFPSTSPTPHPGGAGSAGAEDGSHRTAGRRRGARLQQPADRHPGLLRAAAGGSRPDDPRRTDIAEIQKAGARAAGLTRQLLAFSRKQIIQPTRLDLNVVVADMQAMLGRLIGED